MKSVLFVCTGNTCRSPLAEALFREMVKGRSDFEVHSAGLGAYSGQPAASHSARLAKKLGLDLSKHRSRAVTSDLVGSATHIFGMSRHHLSAIEMDFPEAADKTYLLTEFCADDDLRGTDLPDPFGGDLGAYEELLSDLQKILPSVFAYIEQTSKERSDSEPEAAP